MRSPGGCSDPDSATAHFRPAKVVEQLARAQRRMLVWPADKSACRMSFPAAPTGSLSKPPAETFRRGAAAAGFSTAYAEASMEGTWKRRVRLNGSVATRMRPETHLVQHGLGGGGDKNVRRRGAVNLEKLRKLVDQTVRTKGGLNVWIKRVSGKSF